MAKSIATWLEQLNKAAVDYFSTEKGRDFSVAAIEQLAAKRKIKVPSGTDMKRVQAQLVKHVKQFGKFVGIRVDGIKLDDGKKPAAMKKTKFGKRLESLMTAKKWTSARGAKEFGLPEKKFNELFAMNARGPLSRLLDIYEDPKKLHVPAAKSIAQEPQWELRTKESKRLLKLKEKFGWGIKEVCKAFDMDPTSAKWFLHGHTKAGLFSVRSGMRSDFNEGAECQRNWDMN